MSEGQFKQVLDIELPKLKGEVLHPISIARLLNERAEACEQLKIKPTITLIVVGKRHHVRFFPTAKENGDRSGNCRAGTVVDRDVTTPVEFDFYLQSHGGLLGTSRPAHYNVLYDENGFSWVLFLGFASAGR